MKIRRIDFSPDEWLAGTLELSEFDRGVYITICALIYSRGDRIGEELLRRHCQCHGNALAASLNRLQAARKITRNGSEIGQKRSENELETVRKRLRNASENGSYGNEIKKVIAATRTQNEHANHQLPTINIETPLQGESKRNGFDPSPMLSIFAEECSPPLPSPSKMTAARKTACRARYTDLAGDLEAWRAICRRVRASPFLVGTNDRSWRADFDWVLKQANFTKISEGKYDPPGGATHNGRDEPSQPLTDAQREEIIRRTYGGGEMGLVR